MENNQQKIAKQILDNYIYGVYNKDMDEKITIEAIEIEERRLIKILENINMNKITEMFESLTDIEVKQAIKEIKDSAEGIITSSGMIRRMAENMSIINKLKVSDNLFSAEILLLKQGAFRFIR